MKCTLWIGLMVVAGVTAGCATDVADQKFASNASRETQAQAYCVRDTGSRIKVKEGECRNGAAGRTYSREELETTGAMTPGEALKKLDPRLN
jgi:hypothetical protein